MRATTRSSRTSSSSANPNGSPTSSSSSSRSIRRRIQDTYIHDTLSEAIAVELEREHGFIYVSDDSLVAAVNISTDEGENFLVRTEVELADADEDDDDDDDDDDEEDEDVDYKAVIVELDPRMRLN